MTSPRLQDLTFEQLQDHLLEDGLPKFRAVQVWQGLFGEMAASYEDITPLPKTLRAALTLRLPWTRLDLLQLVRSKDRRTAKALFQLEDGETIESVIMIYPERSTVCLSTQVGCAMGCTFCATGLGGFVRNLTPGEIVAQTCFAAKWLKDQGRRLSNLVYMGMGEPLANYDATLRSIRILNDSRGMGIGARSFTISTVGLPDGIDRLADEPLQVNLAVSLHAATDQRRSRLVPVNDRYPISAVLGACRRYIEKTHRRVSFEMTLIENVNDAESDATELANLLQGMLCHVNLIPLNAPTTERSKLGTSSSDRVQAFADVLDRQGIPVSVRSSRGAEIDAGCGQLRARNASN